MKTDHLKSIFLFRGMESEEINTELENVRDNGGNISLNNYDEDSVISEGGEICYMISGKAEIRSNNGGSAVIRIVKEGDVFGAGLIYATSSPQKTVTISITKSSVLKIDRNAVDTIMKNNSGVPRNYIEFLSDRIAFLNDRIGTFTAESVNSRFMIFLKDMYVKNGPVFEIEDSYTVLADKFDIGRASLYRTMDMLERSNLIKRHGRAIEIVSPEIFKNVNQL